MAEHNQTNDLNAIKTSLLKIAQGIGQPQAPVSAPGQEAPATQPGSPEEVMGLIDDAIQVLEVASESVPAEKPGTPGALAPVTAKTKSAQEEEDEKNGEKKEATDEDEKNGEKKEATDEDDTDKEKELKARIAALEDDKEEKEKEKVAKEFVELYPESIRQAKFDAIIASDVKSSVLSEQFKVAQDLSEAKIEANQPYIPSGSQGGYLTKQAKLINSVKPWRT